MPNGGYCLYNPQKLVVYCLKNSWTVSYRNYFSSLFVLLTWMRFSEWTSSTNLLKVWECPISPWSNWISTEVSLCLCSRKPVTDSRIRSVGLHCMVWRAHSHQVWQGILTQSCSEITRRQVFISTSFSSRLHNWFLILHEMGLFCFYNALAALILKQESVFGFS